MPPLSAAEARILSLLLARLRALPPVERAAWLEALPAGQQALVPRLRQRLAELEQPGEEVVAPVKLKPAAPPHPRFGERVGPYRLLAPLGQGDDGPVWKAERADGGHGKNQGRPHPVALFLPADSTAAERQIVTLPEHPHTVRLQDAGMAADGRLYRVLPWVEGVGLLEHAQHRGSNVRQRVQLMLALCRLVAHAHAERVAHGDLRAANVRVDDEGQVTLLDWGRGQVLRAPNAAAEVQALGRLLQRLLEGQAAGPDLPAVVAAATATPPRLATVDALAEELQRVLAYQPIQSAAASSLHLLRLFLRRRRAALAVGVLAAVLLAVGATVALRLVLRGQAQDQRGQQVQKFLQNALPDVPDSDIAVQAPRLQRALEQARAGFPGEPVLRGQVITELGVRFRALGQPEQAQDVLREALTLLQGNAQPGEPALHAAQMQLALQLQQSSAPGAAAQAAALVQQALAGCASGSEACAAVRQLAPPTPR